MELPSGSTQEGRARAASPRAETTASQAQREAPHLTLPLALTLTLTLPLALTLALPLALPLPCSYVDFYTGGRLAMGSTAIGREASRIAA